MPSLPARFLVFVDDGRTDRSKESFQGVSFANLDQTAKTPISFFRSDFRKAKVTDCTFVGNNFSRCDFISTIFENSRFEKCDLLTSAMMNCVLRSCEFENNQPFNPDIFRCRLSDCTFLDQSVERATWRDSAFVNCTFEHCAIERSSLENIEFEDCRLDNLDLSQITANDLHFIRGTLDNVTLDPDYLGTYTFEDVKLADIHFRYRSAGLDFSIANPGDLLALAEHFTTQRRWSEVFNIFALLIQIHGQEHQYVSLEIQWERCLLGALELDIPADAAENVRRLFSHAKHYLKIGLITASDSLLLLACVELVYRLSLNQLVLEEVAVGALQLRRAIETLPRMEEALLADPRGSTNVRFQVQLDTDNEELATTGFVAFFDQVAHKHGIPFEILKVGVGSVIVEAATWFVVVMMFFRAAKAASYTMADIRVVSKAGDRVRQIMDQATEPRQVIEAMKLLHRTLPKETNVRDLVGEEVADIGRGFRTLMHEIKVGGTDFLALVREVRIFVNDLRKPD